MSTDPVDPARSVYEVGTIIADRIRKGVQEYRVKWLRFGPEEDSWEPITNLKGCPEMVREYNKSKSRVASRSRSRGRPAGKASSPAKSKSKSASRGRVAARSTSRARARSKSANKAKQAAKPSPKQKQPAKSPARPKQAAKSPARPARKASPAKRWSPVEEKKVSPAQSTPLSRTPIKQPLSSLFTLRPVSLGEGESNAGVTPPRSSSRLYNLRSFEANGGSESVAKRPASPLRPSRQSRPNRLGLNQRHILVALLVGAIGMIIFALAYYGRIPRNYFDAFIKKLRK